MFNENQIVWGGKAGVFRVQKLDTICGIEGAFLKEVHPQTFKMGNHPALFLPLDAITDRPPESKPSDIVVADILETIRPFVEAKKYNPNKSTSVTTTRTMSVRQFEIDALEALFAKLGGS